MTEDYFTHTEADAGEYERHRAEPDDDRPTLAELNAEEHEARGVYYESDMHDGPTP